MEENKKDKSKSKPNKPTITAKKDELDVLPHKDRLTELYLKQPNTKSVAYVTDIGMYAGDI